MSVAASSSSDDADQRDRAEAYRRRLLDGLAQAIRDTGFRAVSVADVVRLARTSRRTFYEHFAGLEECYVALMRSENRRIIEATAAAVEPSAAWTTQIEQAVTAWSRAALSEPALVRSWIREMAALGDAGRDLQRELLQSFAELVTTLADSDELRAAGISAPSRAATVLLLGGLRELLATWFEEGVLDDPAALDELVRAATAATIAIVAANV